MKHFTALLFLAFAMWAGKTMAQNDTTFVGSLTDDTRAVASYDLQGCIQYALDNSEALKKAKIQTQIAEAEIGERISVGLPSVKFEASAINNLRVPRQFLPDGSLFGLPPGPVAVAFQTQFSGSASLQVNQLVFDFSYLIGVRAARAFMELTQKQGELSKQDIAERVAKAYYGILINKERINLVQLNIMRLDSILKDAKTLNANGLVEKIDVMRAEVASNNMRTELKKILQLQDLSMQLLKFQMGMPVRDSLTIEGSLRDVTVNLAEDINTPLEKSKRVEFAVLTMTKTMQDLNAKYTKSVYYPRLYAFGNLGANTGQNEFKEFWRFNDRWFRNAYVGLSLQWNIFDGFKRRHSLQKIKLEILKIKEDEKSLQRSIDFEIEKSKTSLKSNLEDLEIQRRNLQLAQEVVILAQTKYKGGTGTNIEFINAQASYKEAENNYYTSLYNAILNKVELQKALGKF
jgi:outer membrane protein TolC